MDLEKILSEMHSDGMKEMVKTIWDTVERVRNGQISPELAHLEIIGSKHILQSFALSLALEQHRKGTRVYTVDHKLNGKKRVK